MDDEVYDLEYSEESSSERDADLENQYYDSKYGKEKDPDVSLASFQKVLDLEKGEKGEWGFKALKQMIMINFRLKNYEQMMVRYEQLLNYIYAVTPNHWKTSINYIFRYISKNSCQDHTSFNYQMGLLQNFYEITWEALNNYRNDPLWIKINTKHRKLYFESSVYS